MATRLARLRLASLLLSASDVERVDRPPAAHLQLLLLLAPRREEKSALISRRDTYS